MHTHKYTLLQREKGKQMRCCSTGEDIKLIMRFIILLFMWPLLSAINKRFTLLMLLCDTANEPAWSCTTNPYSDVPQSAEYTYIMHYTSEIFKLFVRVKSWSHTVSFCGRQLGVLVMSILAGHPKCVTTASCHQSLQWYKTLSVALSTPDQNPKEAIH